MPGEHNTIIPMATVYLLDRENTKNLKEYTDKIFKDREFTIEEILDNGGRLFMLKPDGQGPPIYKLFSLDKSNTDLLTTSGQLSFLYNGDDYYIAIFGTKSRILRAIANTVNSVK